jgi:hypothetical protein
VIVSRRVRLTYVTSMGKMRNAHKMLENMTGKDHFVDWGRRIILKWILKT